jgi:transcriptional regulator with PAS, ATPase and Fis domain
VIIWKELLRPIIINAKVNETVKDTIKKLLNSGSNIAFVQEHEVIGYVKLENLLTDNVEKDFLDKEIQNFIQTDVLKVPETSAVEFYYNCSVFVSVDEFNQITGYTTKEQARDHINEIRLFQLTKSIDSAEIGIITFDKEFSISFMNETAESILGLSRSFLIERNYKELIQFDKDIEAVLDGQRLMNVTTTFNFKKMNGHFSPIYTEEKITGIVHIFFLQSHLEETARELEFVRELNEDLQAIYSSSNEQILVVNAKGEITQISGTFLSDFWGTEIKNDVIGRNVFDLEQEEIFSPNIVNACLIDKKKVSLVQRTKQGFQVWSTATPIFNEDERIKKIIVISRDITSFNKLHEEFEEVRKSSNPDQDIKPLKTLIYRSMEMSQLVSEMKRVARANSTVLISGESGVGKEVFAQQIHFHSLRKEKSFVSMNCGAIPENLLESELFGYEKGAFTGASNLKKGLFEVANGGTIFLDEITELPLHMQVKLLRALQEREITRIGGLKPIQIDVRVIATTNRNIEELVKEKKFREDLYYRLNVIPMYLPPLRERKEDIISLSLHFLTELNSSYEMDKSISREGLLLLEDYHWPGNVRELQNVIERLFVTSRSLSIQEDDVFKTLYKSRETFKDRVVVEEIIPLKEAVNELEEKLIAMAMKKYGKAADVAKALKVSPATISRRVKNYLK